jgi:hypothetical protein
VIGGADWGSVPTWFGLVAAVVAGIAYVTGRRDSRRALASSVYVMVVSGTYQVDLKLWPPRVVAEFQLVNDSSGPIFDCHVMLSQYGARRRHFWRLRLHEGRLTTPRIMTRSLTAVWPKGKSTRIDLGGPITQVPAADIREWWAITLAFRDANGRRWIRWPDGRLSPGRWSRRRPLDVTKLDLATLEATSQRLGSRGESDD